MQVSNKDIARNIPKLTSFHLDGFEVKSKSNLQTESSSDG